MSEYRVFENGKTNRSVYKKDQYFIKKENIPVNIFNQLKPGIIVSDDNVPPSDPVKQCIFCGEQAKYTRTLVGQTVAICDEHYFTKNSGQIAEKIRSLAGETT